MRKPSHTERPHGGAPGHWSWPRCHCVNEEPSGDSSPQLLSHSQPLCLSWSHRQCRAETSHLLCALSNSQPPDSVSITNGCFQLRSCEVNCYMVIVTGITPSSEASGHLAPSSTAFVAMVINELTLQAIPSLMTVFPIEL